MDPELNSKKYFFFEPILAKTASFLRLSQINRIVSVDFFLISKTNFTITLIYPSFILVMFIHQNIKTFFVVIHNTQIYILM